tara:strand:- start:10169 stop:10333 length:165 start_codon:yes stop_codon:yes gene_type:complete
MTIQVKYEQHLVCFLEFEDQKDFDEWEDNGASLDDADIVREKSHCDYEIVDEED